MIGCRVGCFKTNEKYERESGQDLEILLGGRARRGGKYVGDASLREPQSSYSLEVVDLKAPS
jgi:hypothetical protein